ncbi:MAG: flavin reductase family protein [Azoarcus sp.]|jgi:flavin reductase (DIM6/NTAB) family NADH-FMN oxidoreductase RutF|nr:flavin reductase family protein [Azoarcus sp.]MDD2874264.1 flavin reductase family protein [Azoarcus sp.]MDX9838380.1 flavin reductase family protein [Azoarcus sp.]
MSQNAPAAEDFSRSFRNALGRFATGITVVTMRAPTGELVGLTVNSFNSVSLDPPLVVWSLSSNLPSLKLFEACEYYAINVLAADQEALSQRFASRMGERFSGLGYDHGEGGAPLLHGCCARFVCRNTARHEGGDHVIFVSEVVSFDRSDAEPLVYFGGAYRHLSP